MTVENITLRKIVTLCDCLAVLEGRRIDVIRDRYSRRETDFEDTLEVFRHLGLVSHADGIVTLVQDFERWLIKAQQRRLNIRIIRNFFADKILAQPRSSSREIYEFFYNFSNIGSSLVFMPSNEKRLQFANIRNLFVGLGIIEVSKDGRHYTIVTRFEKTIRCLLMPTPITPAKLATVLQQQELSGCVAEEFVLQFEKKRLLMQPELMTRVLHTSKVNASAGYDIESFHGSDLLDEPSRQRYIEVKAVSRNNYEFFWSRNEMAAAQLLTTDYFLYLVPMLKNQKCKVEGMLIIQDPHAYFAYNNSLWCHVCEIMRVRRD